MDSNSNSNFKATKLHLKFVVTPRYAHATNLKYNTTIDKTDTLSRKLFSTNENIPPVRGTL